MDGFSRGSGSVPYDDWDGGDSIDSYIVSPLHIRFVGMSFVCWPATGVDGCRVITSLFLST